MEFLITPNADFECEYRDYIEELGEEERYPFPLDFDHSDFNAMLLKINRFELGIDLPDGYVSSSTYWLVNQHNCLIGVSNLRHRLNESLTFAGGHIGLGIRPSFRGCGFGKVLLTKTMEKARERNINELSVHCYEDNRGSNALLKACGGILDSVVSLGNECQRVNRYRFDL